NKDTYKIVPPDYELTEEDKQNQLREDYFISYGSSEVYTQEASNVVWVQDGVTYDLLGFDVDVSADEMMQMAQEIIQQQ
ncbi:MAG: signal peptide protein, partial [Lachnospiraceae bacterium]|nr:signal peptide protein [Lachnospiraceae bacterium]